MPGRDGKRAGPPRRPSSRRLRSDQVTLVPKIMVGSRRTREVLVLIGMLLAVVVIPTVLFFALQWSLCLGLHQHVTLEDCVQHRY